MVRLVLALAFVVSFAVASDTERLREDIRSLEFLNRLGLSRTQVLHLLPYAERGAHHRRGFEMERDALYVRFHDALVRFREEDLRNEGLSDAVLRDAGGISHQFKVLGTRLAAVLEPLEVQVAPTLATDQVRIAMPRIEDRHPLDLLREMRGSDFQELRDTLARALANRRVNAGLVERHRRRDERLRIRAVLHELRRMDEASYRDRREELLLALVPGRERAQVSAEIRRIYSARYGRAGPLAQHLFRARMLPILAERAGLDDYSPPPAPRTGRTIAAGDLSKVKERIAALKADINLLNLMNGLHLDARQLKAIRKAARACAKLQPGLTWPDDARALREVYDALRCGERVPASARSKLTPQEVKRGRGYIKARRREFQEACDKGVEELLDVLSPEHGEVIRTYKSCLVPPKDLRDPVRAGQANDNGPLERMVDRLRRMRPNREAAERFLVRVEQSEGRIPEDERDATLTLVLAIAARAHALDDVSYAASRTELAEQLAPVRRLHTLKERLMELDGADKVIRHKIGRFLLDPRIVPLADDRLRRLKNPQAKARADVPKAEVCEEGKCGKP